jgi:hypothetical protein
MMHTVNLYTQNLLEKYDSCTHTLDMHSNVQCTLSILLSLQLLIIDYYYVH